MPTGYSCRDSPGPPDVFQTTCQAKVLEDGSSRSDPDVEDAFSFGVLCHLLTFLLLVVNVELTMKAE